MRDPRLIGAGPEPLPDSGDGGTADGGHGLRVPGLDVAPDPLEVRTQIRRRLVSQLAILLEAVVDHVLETKRQFGIQSHRRDRRAIEDRRQDHRGGLAREWVTASRALVEHDAEGKQIGAPVELFAGGLLRRHVGNRPERDAPDGPLREVARRA